MESCRKRTRGHHHRHNPGLSAGVLVYAWKGDAMVSIVICMSTICNSLVASTFGAIVPLVLNRFKYDPPLEVELSSRWSLIFSVSFHSWGLRPLVSK
ncbi:MAG: magnesium transporter [Bdellovibrionales bacterium]